MFPFTPHTTLRLSFGLGGSLFLGDFPDRSKEFSAARDSGDRFGIGRRADCPVRIAGQSATRSGNNLSASGPFSPAMLEFSPMYVGKGFSIMSAAAQVTDATFDQEVIASEVPVLVDFWAPWCGPCRMVAPVVDEIASQYEGKVKVVKINTDDNPSVANKYGIRSIPTLMIFKGGQKVDTVVGAVPKTTLANTLDKYL